MRHAWDRACDVIGDDGWMVMVPVAATVASGLTQNPLGYVLGATGITVSVVGAWLVEWRAGDPRKEHAE